MNISIPEEDRVLISYTVVRPITILGSKIAELSHTELEKILATIWHKILTVENIDESGLGKF